MSIPSVLNGVGHIDRALLRIVTQRPGLELVTVLDLLGESLYSCWVLRPDRTMEKHR